MEENCSVYYQVFPDPSLSLFAIIPFAVVYFLFFILGLAGNSLLIYVTLKNKVLQEYGKKMRGIIFECNNCKGEQIHFLGVSIFICTFSLGAIAVDRYILVVRPHTKPLSRRGAVIATLILWSLSFIVTLPYAFNMEMVDFSSQGVCGKFCTERWTTALGRRSYTMVVMFSQFALPFTLMAFCYAHIFLVLNRRAKVKLRRMDERSIALENSLPPRAHQVTERQQNENNEPVSLALKINSVNSFLDKQEKERQRLIHQNRRTTYILVAMVVWFGLTWLPHNVVSLIIEYDETQTFFRLFGREELDISYLLNLFTHCFAMSNNVVNPVLYAWLNPTFRKLVVATVFGSVGKRGSSRMINRPWVYRTLPPRSHTEKMNDLQAPITTETLISNVTPKVRELEVLKTNDEAEQQNPSSSECGTNTKLIEFDDSDTFV
ncbi:7 transmembrane receptor [Necator americanus]|uniref:7 transmembrane receptor n=1 Tax=Necator americanus TaxID=51031 RepID=W2SNW1_NECAM|nr:7 transmembrane receptor [Necator americanus]ETN71369.1 7 transmembrane receptor [Necator americanus]